MTEKDSNTPISPWTRFMDMHSGGSLKESPYAVILIEAPQSEAEVIFQNRFGHNPKRVTCTCCGDDYSISEEPSLAQATAYDRNCRSLETPRDANGLHVTPTDPAFKAHYYLEDGEDPPPGFKVDRRFNRYREYQTLGQYIERPDVLVIHAKDIKPEERIGELRESGYVWVD